MIDVWNQGAPESLKTTALEQSIFPLAACPVAPHFFRLQTFHALLDLERLSERNARSKPIMKQCTCNCDYCTRSVQDWPMNQLLSTSRRGRPILALCIFRNRRINTIIILLLLSECRHTHQVYCKQTLTWIRLGKVRRETSCRNVSWCHERRCTLCLGHQTVDALPGPSSEGHLNKDNINEVTMRWLNWPGPNLIELL